MKTNLIPHTSNRPLDLLFRHTETSLRRYLEESLNRPVTFTLTENSTSMLSARVRNNILHIRLHRMFLNADNRIIDEVVVFLKRKRSKMYLFRKFIRDNREHLPKRPPNKVPIKTLGKFHDLRALYDEINNEYFEGTINAVITWGSRSPRHAVRKRTLGSYSERSHTIRINPVLDKIAVPRYVVASIVYHEMLHAAMGIFQKGERRSIHSREFRRREKLFKDYERAKAWEAR